MFQKIKLCYARAGLAAAGIFGTSIAMAAEGDPGYQAAFAELQSQATGMIDAAWPVVIAIFVAMFAIRFFKRIGNKI